MKIHKAMVQLEITKKDKSFDKLSQSFESLVNYLEDRNKKEKL